jgi:hypothetical protein
MKDDYQIILQAEYDDEKQRMTADEAKAIAKKLGAEIIDANHFCNPNVKIPRRYMPCFYQDSVGSLWRGDFYVGDGGRCLDVGDVLDDRGGVVLMRKKKPHAHEFMKQKDKCECGEEKE